jgi:hypothetical protein
MQSGGRFRGPLLWGASRQVSACACRPSGSSGGILWIVAIQRLAPARPAFRFDPERVRSTEHNRGYPQDADAPLPGRDDANQRRGDDDGWVELIGSEVDALVFFVGSLFFTSAAALQYVEGGLLRPRRLDWWSNAIQLAGTRLR